MIVEAVLVVGAIALGYKYKSSIETTVKAEVAGLETRLTTAISTEVASLKTKL
jgi:hypothetical protein